MDTYTYVRDGSSGAKIYWRCENKSCKVVSDVEKLTVLEYFALNLTQHHIQGPNSDCDFPDTLQNQNHAIRT